MRILHDSGGANCAVLTDGYFDCVRLFAYPFHGTYYATMSLTDSVTDLGTCPMRDEVRKLLLEHGLNCIKSNELDKVAKALVGANLQKAAAKEFVAVLVPFLSPYALHELNASLLRAEIGNLKTREFLRNDNIIKQLVLAEMQQQQAIPTPRQLTDVLAGNPENLYGVIKFTPVIMSHVRDIIFRELTRLYPDEDKKNQMRALHIVMFNFIGCLCQEASPEYDYAKLNEAQRNAITMFEMRRVAVVMAFNLESRSQPTRAALHLQQEFTEALTLPDNLRLEQPTSRDLDMHGRQFLATISGDQSIQLNMFKPQRKVMLNDAEKKSWQDLLQTLESAHQDFFANYASDIKQLKHATMFGLAFSNLSWAVTAVVGMTEEANQKRQIGIAHETITNVIANLKKLLELPGEKFNMALFQEVMKPLDDALLVLQSNYTEKSAQMDALNNAFADVKTMVDKATRPSPSARL